MLIIQESVVKLKRYKHPVTLFCYSFEVKTCHVCQMTSAFPQLQKKLQPIPLPNQPCSQIGIYLIYDLPENSNGYKHLLVTTCYLSKFCTVQPLKTKTSRDVLRELENIYLTLGVPQIIQHDQEPEFVSEVFLNYIVCIFTILEMA